VIIRDTAPLVAAALYRDPDHHRCVELFTGLRLVNREMLLPAPIIAEVGYLLAAKAGPRIEAAFPRAVAVGDFVPVELMPTDYDRMADLVEQYADLPLGTSAIGRVTNLPISAAQLPLFKIPHYTTSPHQDQRACTSYTPDSEPYHDPPRVKDSASDCA
jgi:uncharacterized protein